MFENQTLRGITIPDETTVTLQVLFTSIIYVLPVFIYNRDAFNGESASVLS